MFKKLKNAIKSAPKRSIAIVAAILGISIAVPVAVGAWGDNGNGRPTYTIEEINNGALGDKITFNSIVDSKSTALTDERNFVGVREDTGVNSGTSNKWYDTLKVENGKTYIIRMFVHNDSPNKEAAMAKDVTAMFELPNSISKSIGVSGLFSSSNATPSKYWDEATFTSDKNFSITYVPGSALIESNGKVGGSKLSDNIVTKTGVKLGYDSLNGEIPGCFEYSSFVTIKVKVNFSDDFLVEKKVRKEGDKDWVEKVTANVGDVVQYQIQYRNLSNATTTGVMAKDVLPSNMQYISGSTIGFNSAHPNGIALDDGITTTGINIGGYTPNSNGYVRFSARVIDENLTCGLNTLTNWAQITSNGDVRQDSALVSVTKECEEIPQEMCKIPGKTHLPVNDPGCKPDELPVTGPESIVGGIVGLGSIGTAGAYYIASRRKLN